MKAQGGGYRAGENVAFSSFTLVKYIVSCIKKYEP